MEVIVDRDACEANGVCVELVPGVFRLDDDDVLHITPPDPSQYDQVRAAVLSCPKAALSLRE